MEAIRKAVDCDIDEIKKLIDRHRHELGFVLRSALQKSIQRGEVMVAVSSSSVVGVLEYHHRRDEQTTVYHIAVDGSWRRRGVAGRLLAALQEECVAKDKRFVLLRCPVGLPANGFYPTVGFVLTATETGRSRALNVWRLNLQSNTN